MRLTTIKMGEAGTYPQIHSNGVHPYVKTTAASLLVGHKNYVAAVGEFGITELSIIVHDWQRWG